MSRSLPRRSLVPLLLAGALQAGCPFRSFEVESTTDTGSGGGGGSRAGTGGIVTGGTPTGSGGTLHKAAPPQAFDDVYFVRQGEELHVREAGVLANDAPAQLEVVDSDVLPGSRKDNFEVTSTVGPQGSFDFVPDPRFFGVYALSYTVKNLDEVADQARITVNVAPVSVALDVLSSEVGGIVLDGSARGDRLGTALESAGDVDGDGIGDLLVGAPGASAGSGAVYLVFGNSQLRALELSATLEDSSYAAFVGEAGEGLGRALALQAGPDPLLLLGAAEGLGRVYRVRLTFAHEARGKVVALDAESGAALVGDDRLAAVGRLVADAGDVDGDGRRDTLIASSEGDRGVLHVVYGSEPPLSTQPLADAPALTLSGAEDGDGFPLSFAGAGDQNGDGRADVLVATSSNLLLLAGGSEYPSSESDVSIDGSEFGWRALRAAPGTNASVASVGDLDGDGVQEIAYCDGALGCRTVKTPPSTLTNGWSVSGFSMNAGRLLVAAAGDVDADGVTDILFAEDSYVYVVYGRPVGHEDISVGFLGVSGFRLSMPGGRPVTALAGIGDVNNDGLDDIAIGDAGAKSGAGRVYIVFGVPSR